MERVPVGAFALVPSCARVMVAEPVHDHVPDRLELLEEQELGQSDPDFVNSQVAAGEMREVQVLRPLDGLSVLGKSAVQGR